MKTSKITEPAVLESTADADVSIRGFLRLRLQPSEQQQHQQQLAVPLATTVSPATATTAALRTPPQPASEVFNEATTLNLLQPFLMLVVKASEPTFGYSYLDCFGEFIKKVISHSVTKTSSNVWNLQNWCQPLNNMLEMPTIWRNQM